MGINPDYFNCINTNETLTNTDNITTIVNHCDSYLSNTKEGYVPIVTLIIAIIGLLLNGYLILKEDFLNKTKYNSRKQSSMKHLFAILPILDCITSLYWIISSLVFKKSEDIHNNMNFCFILSIVYFTVFTFEFFLINFILVHFRKISLNPIEGILQPRKNIKKYMALSLIGTIIITGTAIFFKVIGRSIMNTCFINTEQSGHRGLIFLIPIILTLLAIFQILYDLKCRKLFNNDKQVREAYKLNSMYVLVFSLLHIPMFILIIITSVEKANIVIDDNNRKYLKYYSAFTTFLTCSIPMIIGLIRNWRGFTKLKKVKEIQRRLSRRISSRKTNKSLNESIIDDQFDWLEKHSMEFFMRDIYLSIAHCIYNSKSYGTNIYLEDLDKENEAMIKHNICFENFKLNDITVNQSEYLDVNVIEYAPKIFAYLRNLEHINIKEMVNSFLPINNKQGISESQGKSGSFFLSTDDNQYMIKTLRVDEFDLIRKTFLNQYVNHITNNPYSLLCRIYGMYNIILSRGDEVLIIVMRNVIGEFKNNITAQYDLKGSSKNRISDFDMAKSDVSTMKDLNFNEFEHGIMISNKNIRRLRELASLDSKFLYQMDLMDYSLFLVKLTLPKDQATDLFGDQIMEEQERAFNDLMVESTLKSTNSLLNYDDQNLKIDNDNKNVNSIKINRTSKEKGEIFMNCKYYKQYLFPSLIPGQAYILAIIDYFQMFNFYKYVESGLKTKFGLKKSKVSCVDPKTYSKRFITYIIKVTNIKHMLKDGQKTDESNLTKNPPHYEEEEKELMYGGGSELELGLMDNN